MTYVKVGKKFEDGGSADFVVDWKDNPVAVMEEVARKLADLGFEVHSHDTLGDFYAFSIVKKN